MHQELMILSFGIYEKIYLQDSLKGVLKIVHVSGLDEFPHDLQTVRYILRCFSLREKKEMREFSQGLLGHL